MDTGFKKIPAKELQVKGHTNSASTALAHKKVAPLALVTRALCQPHQEVNTGTT